MYSFFGQFDTIEKLKEARSILLDLAGAEYRSYTDDSVIAGLIGHIEWLRYVIESEHATDAFARYARCFARCIARLRFWFDDPETVRLAIRRFELEYFNPRFSKITGALCA